MTMDDSTLWQIRHFVYSHFADTAHPPTVADTAMHFNISIEETGECYQELNNRNALFLEPSSLTIRMANPFSGIPTDFKVHANGQTYFANCAWDSLGIPVVLQSDAAIDSVCAQSGEKISLTVRGGEVQSDAALVHFLVPFKDWYNDLPFT